MSVYEVKIAFLGAGNMAEALIKGILTSKLVTPEHIVAYDVAPLRLEKLKKELQISVASSNKEAVDGADVVFFAVKPQNINEVIQEINTSSYEKTLFVSIAAGVRIEKIEQVFNQRIKIIRVMPNLPALVQSGISALCQGGEASSQDLELVEKLFQSVGEVVRVTNENDLDAVTALSGSGPGYLFHFAEALQKAGVAVGLSESVVEKLVASTLLGSSKMLCQSTESAEALRKKVTSKGGTTEAALSVLEKHCFVSNIEEAIAAAVQRSRELSQ